MLLPYYRKDILMHSYRPITDALTENGYRCTLTSDEFVQYTNDHHDVSLSHPERILISDQDHALLIHSDLHLDATEVPSVHIQTLKSYGPAKNVLQWQCSTALLFQHIYLFHASLRTFGIDAPSGRSLNLWAAQSATENVRWTAESDTFQMTQSSLSGGIYTPSTIHHCTIDVPEHFMIYGSYLTDQTLTVRHHEPLIFDPHHHLSFRLPVHETIIPVALTESPTHQPHISLWQRSFTFAELERHLADESLDWAYDAGFCAPETLDATLLRHRLQATLTYFRHLTHKDFS